MACVTTSLPRHTVAILGGGITGLSTAYYISRKFGPSVRPVIFESTGRSGGWIQSLRHDNNIYELGPRTIRAANGKLALNTLDLLEEIGLDKCINYLPGDNEAVKNKLVYLDGELILLPMDMKAAFETVPPFKEPIFKTVIREMFRRRQKCSDDSMHGFIARRFDPFIADNLVDPFVRGVCAGDARKISVKFFFPNMFRLEQTFGSVILGKFLEALLFRKQVDADKNLPGFDKIGTTDLAICSQKQNWNVWTLENGLESLPEALEKKVIENGGVIHKNSPVKSIKFDDVEPTKNEVEYIDPATNQPTKLQCSHIVSAMPAIELAKVFQQSPPFFTTTAVTDLLNTIQCESLTVTNFKFAHPLSNPAFGFLVPSNQKDLEGLLGVVFNTCVFPQNDDTIITTMSRGIDLPTINKYLDKVLKYDNPSFVNTVERINCIPQYTVGHYERVESLRNIIKTSKLPLILAGASYDGVSVNDCIFSGRRTSEKLPFDLS